MSAFCTPWKVGHETGLSQGVDIYALGESHPHELQTSGHSMRIRNSGRHHVGLGPKSGAGVSRRSYTHRTTHAVQPRTSVASAGVCHIPTMETARWQGHNGASRYRNAADRLVHRLHSWFYCGPAASRPPSERHGTAGPGRGAVAGHVVVELHVRMFRSAGQRDPVADLRVARVHPRPRQR